VNLDTIIFGDNQFFGINHMSEDRARALAERFRSLEAITNVLDTAWDCGIQAYMLNANQRAESICDYLRSSPQSADLRMYPSIPYPHKYAATVNQKGLFPALTELGGEGGLRSLAKRGASSILRGDMLPLMRSLIDAEMRIYRGLDVRVLFLQNIVTDLCLGFGARDVLAGFADHLRERWKVEPGFLSMNLPTLVPFLHECGIENPVVCSSINKAGYFMNPDRASVEQALTAGGHQPIAMSVLASGAIPPREAIEYVASLPIRSIVFGASSRAHIAETSTLIRELLGE